MEKLDTFYIKRDEFITSDKILNFCQGLNDAQYIKTDFLKFSRNHNLVNMTNWRSIDKTVDLNSVKVLVTGHSDYEITNAQQDILDNPELTKMFSQNINIRHPKLVALPLGITNKDEAGSRIHSIIGNTDVIYFVTKTPKTIKNLVYMNFNAKTFPSERELVFNRYKDNTWVTVGSHAFTTEAHYDFIKEIYSHKFVFAPRGNGMDTHRLWESLYLRTIPIVKKCLAMEQFYDLPILFVDDWNDITEEFLNNKYEEIMGKTYPLEKLKIQYWLNSISNALQTKTDP